MTTTNRASRLPSALTGVAGFICLVAMPPVAGAEELAPVIGAEEVATPGSGERVDSPAAPGDSQPGTADVPAPADPAAPAGAQPGVTEPAREEIAPSLEQPGAAGAPMVIPGVVPFAPVPTPAGVEVPGMPPAPDGSVATDPLLGLPTLDPLATSPPPPEFEETATDLPAADSSDDEGWVSPAAAIFPSLGGRSSGFNNAPSGFGPPGGFGNPLVEGLTGSASLTGTYDSNPSQGYGPVGSRGESDFYLTLGGTVSYLSKAPVWTFGASYSGGYNQFFNQTDLSGYFQNAGASVGYTGGRLSATLRVGLDFGSGANRYYASVVDQLSVTSGLNARYRVSSKTHVTGEISYHLNSASGTRNSDTGSFDIGSAALWRYSDRTEFGPGARYTVRTGDSQQDRTTFGPTLTLNYDLTSKVSLDSRVGVDFVEYSRGGSGDPMFSASIGCRWQASRLWGLNLSVYRDSEADPSWPGAFNEITSFRVGYHRKIRRALFNCGVSYESNTSESPGLIGGIRPDRDYFTVDGSLGMPVFANTCNANVFMRYRDQNGGAANSWDSFQIGLGLVRQF